MQGMPATDQRVAVSPSARHRFGLMKMRVGSAHLVVQRDEKKKLHTQQLTVRERVRHHDAKVDWICLHPECRGAVFASEAELVQSHPDAAELEKEMARHVYGMFSAALVKNGEKEIIGLLSDET